MSFAQFRRWAMRATISLAAVAVLGTVTAIWLWRDRPSLGDIGWTPYPSLEPGPGAVAMTWLGVTTLLFDDGQTQLLIDGFFSRPSLADVLLRRKVDIDAATINRVIDDYRLRRLAAIIPLHSHYDHAMDVGAIANRSSASILGSESTANIARGAGVPDDQIVVVEDGAEYQFGEFNVTMLPGSHAPVGWGGSVPFAGTIDEPLRLPAPVSAWRAGQSYTIVIAHPSGTTLVQGSAGVRPGKLDNIHADTVMLGIGLIERLGRDYTERYWQSIVTTTGAKHVFVLHFDDFTRPFGEIVAWPRALENVVDVARWLEQIRDTWDTDTRLHLPAFGVPTILYPLAAPET